MAKSSNYWLDSKDEAKRILSEVLDTPYAREIDFELHASVVDFTEITYKVTVAVVPAHENKVGGSI